MLPKFKIGINLKRFDWLLFGGVFLLIIIGLIVQYSLGLNAESFSRFERQAIFSGVGFLLFFILSFIDYRYFKKYAYYIYGLSLVLLLITLFFGESVRGTRRWIFGFQTIEFVKLALILVLARFWSDNLEKYSSFKKIFLSILLSSVAIVLIFFQPDFGGSFLLMIITFGMIIAVDRFGKKTMAIALLGLLVLGLSWVFLFRDYQKNRILDFVSPQRDSLGTGYQVSQSIIAIGSGGFWGRGFGLGSQSQLKFLPEAETDFVFSALAEEFGFLIVMIVLLLYVMILWRLMMIALRSYDDFSLLTVVGIATIIFLQLSIAVGMNLGIAPITGLTLPFLSYGGSSLMMSLATLGVAQSVWKHQIRETLSFNLD